MTQQETHQITHSQLSTSMFQSEVDSLEDDEELNEVAIAPTNLDISPQTVRITRPVQPTDFVLQRALASEKELLDLVYRYLYNLLHKSQWYNSKA